MGPTSTHFRKNSMNMEFKGLLELELSDLSNP